MTLLHRITISAATAALVCSPLASASASPGSSGDTVQREKFCNAKRFDSSVRNIATRQIGFATRVHTEATAGRTVYRAGETRTSEFSSNTATQFSVEAEASAEVGGKFPLVSAKVSARTGLSYASQSSDTSSQSRTITNRSKVIIPKATSVAWYSGYAGTKGTAEVSYCDALEGSGEGYVKWSKVRFRLYSTDSASGVQRCDVKARDVVARAAKRNCL